MIRGSSALDVNKIEFYRVYFARYHNFWYMAIKFEALAENIKIFKIT